MRHEAGGILRKLFLPRMRCAALHNGQLKKKASDAGNEVIAISAIARFRV